MANEAKIVQLLGDGGDPISVTVAAGTSLSGGCLLYWSADPRTGAASPNTDVGSIFAGMVAADKSSTDGATQVSCYTHLIADILAGGAVAYGTMVALSGANTVRAQNGGDHLSGTLFGRCLETASANEVVQILIGAY